MLGIVATVITIGLMLLLGDVASAQARERGETAYDGARAALRSGEVTLGQAAPGVVDKPHHVVAETSADGGSRRFTLDAYGASPMNMVLVWSEHDPMSDRYVPFAAMSTDWQDRATGITWHFIDPERFDEHVRALAAE